MSSLLKGLFCILNWNAIYSTNLLSQHWLLLPMGVPVNSIGAHSVGYNINDTSCDTAGHNQVFSVSNLPFGSAQ